MRLWSLHPKYLDPQGLVALWREALLANAVLAGNTRGYRHHPQLERFQSQPSPLCAIGVYLQGVHVEASFRGYSFDANKIQPVREQFLIPVTTGQMQHEWTHLLQKLSVRSPMLYEQWHSIIEPACHPLFTIHAGPIESWERVQTTVSKKGQQQ